jgi:hypothetical protein
MLKQSGKTDSKFLEDAGFVCNKAILIYAIVRDTITRPYTDHMNLL